MATFYTGYRPVIKGRNYNNFVHTYKGEVGVYSNWALFSEENALDGAPNRKVELGDDSRLSRPTLLEYIFSGGQHIAPITDPGSGPRQEGARFRPLTYRGLEGAKAFGAGYGHDTSYETDYARYSNHIFDGLPIAEPLDEPGHYIRYSTTYGGASRPWVHQGVEVAMESGYGDVLPVGYDNEYGKNKINEWRGVPSTKAL